MFILERLIEVVAPLACLKCGSEGAAVCPTCLDSFCTTMPPRCYRCLQLSKDFAVCRGCKPKTALSHVWIATKFKDLPEQLIHNFKFERAQAAAATVAYLMSRALPEMPSDTIVVPVASATSRVRQRGYDHTALLARAVGKERRYSYPKVLKRLGQSRQVGATRVQRLVQLKGAFRAVRSVNGKNILLVDDVVTTGATLEEAARVLHEAGARRIDALVFAQK